MVHVVDKHAVGLSLPAGTVISDAGSIVTLGDLVMNFRLYWVRASEDLTPPPSRKRSSICGSVG